MRWVLWEAQTLYLPNSENPKLLQTTLASAWLHPSSQTWYHDPLWQTSIEPSPSVKFPMIKASLSLQAKKKNDNVYVNKKCHAISGSKFCFTLCVLNELVKLWLRVSWNKETKQTAIKKYFNFTVMWHFLGVRIARTKRHQSEFTDTQQFYTWQGCYVPKESVNPVVCH